MKIPEIFNINLFQILADTYAKDLDRKNKKNVIGWSELPFGMRKIALKKIHSIKTPPDLKTLMGNLFHFLFQQPEPLSNLITQILQETDIVPRKLKIVPEEELQYEIQSNQFLKMKDSHFIEAHIDNYTDIFSWELKTTWTYDRYWSKELLPYHAFQLNGYLGSKMQKWGLLSCINLRAFINTFHSFKDSAEKWSYNLPVLFNENQFELSIKKAILIFNAIDDNDPSLECPVFEWECKDCDVREKKCGKKEIRCTFVDKQNKQCTKIMHEWEECLTDEFLSKPICRNCYENKTNKRMDYDKFKLKKMYPYEVRYE